MQLDEHRQLLLERSRILLGFSVLFFPLNIPLDHIVAPAVAGEILKVRLLVVAALALFLAATFTALGQRLIRPLSVAYALVASLAFVACTWIDGGFTSNYVVGVMLVLVGGCFFLPWRVPPAAVFCAVSVLAYLGLNLLGHGWSETGLAWVAFLLGTSSVAVLATWLNTRSRDTERRQRLELARAKGALEELTEARSRFFANISHELRTPLMLMLGPLEDLLIEQPQDELYRSMWTNGNRLQRQVEMLLDVARLEAGRLQLKPARARLAEVVDALVEAAGPHARRAKLDLQVRGLDELGESLFDAEQIETVLGNLLSNALKFTPPGGRVTVLCGTDDELQWVEVHDTGPGLPADQLDRVFDRFHRVESVGGRGTGLGLSLAKELVDLHGGRLRVRSVQGEGAVFRLELPRVPVSSQVVEAAAGPVVVEVSAGSERVESLLADASGRSVQERSVTAPRDAPSILLVEDNADLRAFVASRLGQTYRVSTAVDGLAGLEAIEALRPDLVLSDVMMPRMDGFELCRRVRQRWPALPFVLLTARGELEDLVGGLHLGADDYVTKPFHLAELRARIDALLRLRLAERRAAEGEARLVAIEAVSEDPARPGVLDAIRDLARLPGRSHVGRTETTSVPEWMAEVLSPLRDELWTEGVELHLVDRSGGAAVASLDRASMEQAVSALVRNAGQAVAAAGTQDGLRHVWLTVEASTDLRIRVADDGPGTPLELARRLFVPASDGRSALVQLRDTVHRHGGKLELEPQADEGGAAFTIRLPSVTSGG